MIGGWFTNPNGANKFGYLIHEVYIYYPDSISDDIVIEGLPSVVMRGETFRVYVDEIELTGPVQDMEFQILNAFPQNWETWREDGYMDFLVGFGVGVQTINLFDIFYRIEMPWLVMSQQIIISHTFMVMAQDVTGGTTMWGGVQLGDFILEEALMYFASVYAFVWQNDDIAPGQKFYDYTLEQPSFLDDDNGFGFAIHATWWDYDGDIIHLYVIFAESEYGFTEARITIEKIDNNNYTVQMTSHQYNPNARMNHWTQDPETEEWDFEIEIYSRHSFKTLTFENRDGELVKFDYTQVSFRASDMEYIHNLTAENWDDLVVDRRMIVMVGDSLRVDMWFEHGREVHKSFTANGYALMLERFATAIGNDVVLAPTREPLTDVTHLPGIIYMVDETFRFLLEMLED